MSTRSTISILNDDGTVQTVYCHFDGHPDHNGFILKNCYATPGAIKELLSLGDMSSLGATIGTKANAKHAIDDNVSVNGKNVSRQCIAYHRDRSEPVRQTMQRTYSNLERFKSQERPQAYNYLFKDGRWLVSEDNFHKFEEIHDFQAR